MSTERIHDVPAGLLDSLRDGGNPPAVRAEAVDRARTAAVRRRPLDRDVATTIATRLLELSLIS